MTTPDGMPRNYRRVGAGLTVCGAALVLLGLVAVVALVGLTAQASAAFERELDVIYERPFAVVRRERSGRDIILGAPAVVFVVAMALLVTGEMLRRGRWVRSNNGGGRRATSTVTLRALRTRTHLAWVVVSALVWTVLIPVPVVSASRGGWPATLAYAIEDDVWFILGLYGGLASAVTAVIAVSVVKKRASARCGAAGVTLPRGRLSTSWRGMAHRGRIDLWIAFSAGAFLGPCWMALYFDDLQFFAVTSAVGAVLLAVAVIAAGQHGRSGEAVAPAE